MPAEGGKRWVSYQIKCRKPEVKKNKKKNFKFNDFFLILMSTIMATTLLFIEIQKVVKR